MCPLMVQPKVIVNLVLTNLQQVQEAQFPIAQEDHNLD
jgi:hypothetical protein